MTPETWAAGQVGPVEMNARIKDANLALSKPPYAILSDCPEYTLTGNGATQELKFSNLVFNKMTALTSGTTKRGVTLQEAGVYDVELNITAEVNGGSPDSHLIVFIMVNGSIAGRGIFTARHVYWQSAHVKRLISMNAGDQVTAHVFTDSGRTMTFGRGETYAAGCRLSLTRIGNYPYTQWP